jgi:hypothetical protein
MIRSVINIFSEINNEAVLLNIATEVIFPDLKHLLKPNDYQNVPFAVQLIKGISDFTLNDIDDRINTVQTHIYKEIECFGEIMRPLLNLFVNPKINLLEQLIQLTYCSHLILHIYRK